MWSLTENNQCDMIINKIWQSDSIEIDIRKNDFVLISNVIDVLNNESQMLIKE